MLSGNSARVSSFVSNSSLGTASISGDVVGSLQAGPLTLGGGLQLFSEWLQGISAFGTSMSFDLTLGDINAVGRPDQLAFFLLDKDQLPFDTSDPTGAGALFYLDLRGPETTPVAFSSAFAAVKVEAIVTGVAEPATELLALAAFAALWLVRSGRLAWRVRPAA